MALPSLRACQESPPLSSAVIAASPGTNVVIVTYIPGKTHRLVLDQSLEPVVLSHACSRRQNKTIVSTSSTATPDLQTPACRECSPSRGCDKGELVCCKQRRQCGKVNVPLEHPADLNYRRWISWVCHSAGEATSVQSNSLSCHQPQLMFCTLGISLTIGIGPRSVSYSRTH